MLSFGIEVEPKIFLPFDYGQCRVQCVEIGQLYVLGVFILRVIVCEREPRAGLIPELLRCSR